MQLHYKIKNLNKFTKRNKILEIFSYCVSDKKRRLKLFQSPLKAFK